MLKVYVQTAWKQVASLQAKWNSLLAQSSSDTIFLTWEWCEAWWATYGGDTRSLFVLSAWLGDQLMGVAPFYKENVRRWHGSATCLRLIGAGSDDSDYLDCFCIVGFETEVASAIIAFLESVDKEWDWVQLDGAPADSQLARTLSESAALSGWTVKAEDVPCAVLNLPNSWEAYLSRLRPRARTKVRSALARAQKLGIEPTECARVSDLEPWLNDLFELHRRRWQKRNRQGVFVTESKRAFYRYLSRVMLQTGRLAFYRLVWGDRTLAMQYGFRYHNRFYSLQEGYDPTFDQLRPGIVLRGLILRNEIKNGVSEYDFLAGVAQHKLDWAAQHRLSRIVRLGKRPLAVSACITLPAMYRSARELAAGYVPSSVRSLRRNPIAASRQGVKGLEGSITKE